MKKILILLACLFSTSAWASTDISTFHRLIVLNEKEEILMVELKDAGFWVTPGIYQDRDNDIQAGLKKLAADYGLEITRPELKAVFSLKGPDNKIFSLRNMFVASVKSYQPKTPKIISEVQWLALEDATNLMTFPHINLMLEQVIRHPDKIWSGVVQRYKEGGEFKARIEVSFYSI